MHKLALQILYQGTRYCGWQIQKGSAASGSPSIQATIQECLEKITQEPIKLVGSGRTDAGVHSLGQVAHFTIGKKWECEKIFKGLNSLLPFDIQIKKVIEVPEDFHAQRSALKKQYSYYFQQGLCAIPQYAKTSRWIRKKLDLEKMSQAAQALLGEHDFKAFQASGAVLGSTVRTIFEAEITPEPIHECLSDDFFYLRFRVVGNGFLKQMVRSLAGTLLEIGENRRAVDSLKELLISKDRAGIGVTAPARGLSQDWVEYPQEFPELL